MRLLVGMRVDLRVVFSLNSMTGSEVCGLDVDLANTIYSILCAVNHCFSEQCNI